MRLMMSGGSRSSIQLNPFTAAQWQELELQFLFFKFMVSGHPIPPDLIFSINGKRSCTTQPQHIGIGNGWSCFEMGSRKTDPEPTRCRRTDGKKWRCSRQTFGDSKYCERHMHRGKSRPTREFVESKHLQLQSRSQFASAARTAQSNLTSSLSTVTTCDTKPAKDPNFMTYLGINHSGWRHDDPDQNKSTSQLNQKVLFCNDDRMQRSEKRQRIIYHQFLEESPREKGDSWLSLII